MMPLSARTAIWSQAPATGPMPRRLVEALRSLSKGCCFVWIASTKTPLVSANSTRLLAIIRVFATNPAVSWLVMLTVLLFLFTTSAMAPAWRNAPAPLPAPTMVALVMAASAPVQARPLTATATAAPLSQLPQELIFSPPC